MKPLRILFIQETNWLDRNVIHQHHLAERLAQCGHAVQVIDYDILWPDRRRPAKWARRQVFPQVSRVIPDVGLTITRPATLQLPLLCHASWSATSLLELRRQIELARPDVVVGLTLTNGYPLALYLKRCRIPYISMVLEPYHTMMPQAWARRPARWVERLALKSADRVVVFTPQMRTYVSTMGAATRKTVLLKTGVSLDDFHPGLNGASARAALGIVPDEWVLFFMGWLYDFSGLREILQALAADRQILCGARLVIAGDGDIYSELQTLAARPGLEDKVLLTGRLPYSQVPALLAAADVCLLPSLENDTTRDIVPMKIYEYLAAGKPVVASRLPGLLAEFGPEFGEANGLVYAGGPLEVLRRAVELKDHPMWAFRIGAAGRRFAEQNADWDKTTAAFEAVLRDACRGAEELAECTAFS